MNKPKVLITRQLLPEVLDLISESTDMEVWPDTYPPSAEKLRELLVDKEGVLTTIMDRIDAEALDAAPKLKVVSQLGVGVDHIDIVEATKRNILVGNTPGVLAKATADIAFALLMSAARRVSEGDQWVREKQWELAFHPLHWLGVDVHSTTLGIVGLGETGLEMVKRAQGFDMEVIYFSRTRKEDLESQYGIKYVSFEELLRNADFVSLHVAYTPDTHFLVGKSQLEMMKETAILINAARGPVVDPEALYEALNNRTIYAAGLDVTYPEPILPTDPLLTLNNIVITPHMGSSAISTRRNTMYMATQNMLAGLNGQQLKACVNPSIYPELGIS